jgi:hypothetical protein
MCADPDVEAVAFRDRSQSLTAWRRRHLDRAKNPAISDHGTHISGCCCSTRRVLSRILTRLGKVGAPDLPRSTADRTRLNERQAIRTGVPRKCHEGDLFRFW